ncbi:MAG: hypothetical protein E6J65_03805 [Deltaproteobacteria bacterium]|nr:MAG: hypothetical protein E6J65_03805 [Deltaproteobacteria bacterium]
MPLPITLAHRTTRRLAEVRRGDLNWPRPDGKSQVAVVYRDGHLLRSRRRWWRGLRTRLRTGGSGHPEWR